jgi:hypothetical protein
MTRKIDPTAFMLPSARPPIALGELPGNAVPGHGPSCSVWSTLLLTRRFVVLRLRMSFGRDPLREFSAIIVPFE